MHNLNLDRVFEALVDQVERGLDNQVVDPDRPNCGAFMNPQLGVADAGSTVLLVAGCAILYSVARGSLSGSGAEALAGQRPLNVLRLKPRFQEWFEAHGDLWLERARLGADYLLRAQRPNGLIDLVTCNYDSSPDTGFAVQRLCPAIALGRLLAVCDPAWAERPSDFVPEPEEDAVNCYGWDGERFLGSDNIAPRE